MSEHTSPDEEVEVCHDESTFDASERLEGDAGEGSSVFHALGPPRRVASSPKARSDGKICDVAVGTGSEGSPLTPGKLKDRRLSIASNLSVSTDCRSDPGTSSPRWTPNQARRMLSGSFQPSTEKAQQIKLASLAMERGDYAQAVQSCTAGLETLTNRAFELEGSPEDKELLIMRAEAYCRQDKVDLAFQDTQALLEEYPDDFEVLLVHGRVCVASGDAEQARVSFSTAAEAASTDAETVSTMVESAWLLWEEKDIPGTMETIKTAMNLEGKSRSSHDLFILQGMCSLAMGKPELALESFLAAGEFLKNYNYYGYLALGYTVLERFAEAVSAYSKAIQMNSKDPDMFLSRAIAHGAQGFQDLCIEDCKTALLLSPEHVAAKVTMGLAHYKKKEYILSSELATEVIEKHDSSEDAYFLRGDCLIELSNLSGAIEDFRSGLKASAEPNPKYQFKLGWALDQRGDHSDAIPHITAAIEMQGDSGAWLLARGQAFHNNGEYRRALDDFKRVEELDGLTSELLDYRGDAHYMLNEYEEAIVCFNKSADMDPENSYATMQIARVKTYRRVISFLPRRCSVM